jgi:hypothetical protein
VGALDGGIGQRVEVQVVGSEQLSSGLAEMLVQHRQPAAAGIGHDRAVLQWSAGAPD